jgi:hypothetical protein
MDALAALHYESKAGFLQALKMGLQANHLRGRGFRIAYGGPQRPRPTRPFS